MQVGDLDVRCPECSERFIDLGEELVCPVCGISRGKEVVDPPPSGAPRPRDAVRAQLGSYMGPLTAPAEGRSARRIAGSDSKYEYLKLVSDFAGRGRGPEDTCARLIERVGEKLFLPRVVLIEAASIAKLVLATVRLRRRIMLAAVSAFSLISACRVEGVTSVGPREIIGAFTDQGRHVDSSSIIQLTLESPVRTYARRPEGYLSKVLGRLSTNRRFLERAEKDRVSVAPYLNSLRSAAKEVMELADQTEMLGKRPCALAASALYSAETVLATHEGRERRVTQRLLAECGDASEYTVREQCAAIFTPAAKVLLARRRPSLPPGPEC